MIIKNFKELAISHEREKVLSIAEAGLQSIDTKNVLETLVKIKGDFLYIGKKKFSLKKTERIIFVGIGKSAVESGLIFESLLGNKLTNGIVLDVKEGKGFGKITSLKGTHPLPSNENIEFTKKILNLLNGSTKNDLVIFLISGGGSALLCLPKEGGPEKEIHITKTLMDRGATIQEMNVVRKHLSMARGGWLSKYAYPAKVASIIFSDVPGNEIEFIASGPTCKDSTTIDDAKHTLEKYKIETDSVDLIETPKEEKYFKNVFNILALSNQTALDSMSKKAKELGFDAKIVTNKLTGEVDEVGKMIAEEINNSPKNTVLIYGGETTVKVKNSGRGGRNLHLALSSLEYLEENVIVLTVASDGKDNGLFGGAICDAITKKDIEKSGYSAKEALNNNDTYPLFEKAGNYLTMGDTGSNVADIVIAMKF